MKTTKLFIGCILVLLYSARVNGNNFLLQHGIGGESEQKQNVIKLNTMGLFIGQYQLAYERVMNEKIAVQLAAGYITLSKSQTMFASSYQSATSGFIVIPEFRYYFKEAPKKFYVALLARVRSVTEKLTDTSNPIGTDVSFKETKMSMGGGIVLGAQFLIANAVAIDIFIGPQYKSRTTKRTYNNIGVTDADFDSKFIDFKIDDKAGAGLRFGINLGFAF